ncbi:MULTISPECIES: Hpt domain-containing protein [unclassified Pseudoalteromonas]|uniref:Hpt domain-containing protein n=1 Tax=unclassified Pseudoalteromonas TaxID=194690 RepID=UPI000CF6BC9A|nr:MULTISPECIES: Hpt domain-containing protein [unclassified Pseudoalteromonas]
MDIKIDESALMAMHDLLGEHFDEILVFCFSEFSRLHSAFQEALGSEQSDAIRNIHSLKSNAAQFGAVTLADTARIIELGLSQGDHQALQAQIDALPSVIEQSIVLIKQWQQQIEINS